MKFNPWFDIALMISVCALSWVFGTATVTHLNEAEQREHERAECILEDSWSDTCCELRGEYYNG